MPLAESSLSLVVAADIREAKTILAAEITALAAAAGSGNHLLIERQSTVLKTLLDMLEDELPEKKPDSPPASPTA